MVELDHLTVSGDVHFGPGVTLKGTVIIIAKEGERIEIPARAGDSSRFGSPCSLQKSVVFCVDSPCYFLFGFAPQPCPMVYID
jgi:hypothetical protein